MESMKPLLLLLLLPKEKKKKHAGAATTLCPRGKRRILCTLNVCVKLSLRQFLDESCWLTPRCDILPENIPAWGGEKQSLGGE